MPRLGAHMSVAGGLHLAFDRLRQIGGEAMQIFVKNQRQWLAPEPDSEAVKLFRRAWQEAGDVPIASHDAYLINLAATDEAVLEKSVNAFADELRRAAALGIGHVVTHPGCHMNRGADEGIRAYVKNLDRAIKLSKTPKDVRILIETTAGQGTCLGSSFEEIARMIESSRFENRLGVCYDTCHTFAAGYDIRTPEAYRETFERFDRLIGIERIGFFHLNDSKRELGSRRDRHEHIGKGAIGIEGFRNLVNDPRFRNHPMVLETPKGKDMKEDVENLALLRSLMVQSEPVPN
ncbi:MAG: deoxyribonuclease IV [Acidobacteriota bacterium]